MERDYLFVYGSLRPPAENTSVIPGALEMRAALKAAAYLGLAEVPGYLVSLGAYPGLILDEAAPAVQGDVFSIDSGAILPLLDRYEGCSVDSPLPHEYHRVRTRVDMHNGRTLEAWVYAWVYDVDKGHEADAGQRQAVADNDWLACNKSGRRD